MSDAFSPDSVATAAARKSAIRRRNDELSSQREKWLRRGAFFHSEDLLYLKFLIPEGSRILELGCGNGHLLAALKPSFGVGVDFSEGMISQARRLHPHLTFVCGDIEDPALVCSLSGPFDVILIVDTLGSLEDCQLFLESLHPLCSRSTRVVIAYFSHLWVPLLKIAEWVRLMMPREAQNVLAPEDVQSIASLANFDSVRTELRLLAPVRIFGLGRLVNRFVAPWPLINRLCLRHYTVCRSQQCVDDQVRSATVVIPARNERGNIEAAVRRIPAFAKLEIIFVEGHSRDGTWDEIQRIIAAYPDLEIKGIRQSGDGKADAVFTGFDAASGDVLLILDADLTMPPEQLSKFWDAIRSGKGEFVNGSRLVYQMEREAMRFLNLVANKMFSIIFTWLLSQRCTDTLCGTKVLRRVDYLKLKQGRSYFGDVDPFGDFDLLFGASKLGLKMVEIPVRYAKRTYGKTQISRFRHGIMLLRMVRLAFFRIKAL
jgi:SAM-dependent methyltransferase